MSTMTLAPMKTGTSRQRWSGKLTQACGPKWSGVKGIWVVFAGNRKSGRMGESPLPLQAAGVPSQAIGLPQLSQNRAPGSFSSPQPSHGLVFASGAPQALQKFADASFSALHLWQRDRPISPEGTPA